MPTHCFQTYLAWKCKFEVKNDKINQSSQHGQFKCHYLPRSWSTFVSMWVRDLSACCMQTGQRWQKAYALSTNEKWKRGMWSILSPLQYPHLSGDSFHVQICAPYKRDSGLGVQRKLLLSLKIQEHPQTPAKTTSPTEAEASLKPRTNVSASNWASSCKERKRLSKNMTGKNS